MMETKNTIKELGKSLRKSSEGHRDALRTQLMGRMQDRKVFTSFPFLKPLLFSGASLLAVVVVIVLGRHEDVVYSIPPSPMVLTEDRAFDGAATAGTAGLVDFYYEESAQVDDEDVIDYENEHGSMMETSTTIAILTREEDAVTEIEALFSSMGGHVSRISSYSVGSPITIAGVVPADGYFLFREQVGELVKADRYMNESLNAQDLIPSAISIDEYIAEATASIENVEKLIAETNDASQKAKLETQLSDLKRRLEHLQESRDSLDDRVAYTEVSVTVNELPTVFSASDEYELRQMIVGFGQAGFIQQAWINFLLVVFWMVQAFSVAFWLIIPVGIWLLVRRKNRRILRALD